MGGVTEEARDRLWLAEALVKQNRRGDADIELQRALAFYRSVGATRYIREGEALLTASAGAWFHGGETCASDPDPAQVLTRLGVGFGNAPPQTQGF